MEDWCLRERHESIPVGQHRIQQFGWQVLQSEILDGEYVIRDFVWQEILI